MTDFNSNQNNTPGTGGTPGQPGAPVPPPPTYQTAPQQNYAQPGQPQPQAQTKTRNPGFGSPQKQKWPAVVLAFTLGYLGIHKFYLGYKTEGLIMLLVCIIGSLCGGLGFLVMLVIGYIEAVKYVSLTEEDFERTYLMQYKGWF